jgi:GDSL-like Lipase/Acylhydrolase family
VHESVPAIPAETRDVPVRRRAGLLRELRSWPTVLLVAFCLVVGLPVTVALTPPQDVVALGQHLAVGARTPTPTIAGPAQLVQIGNTELDLPRLRIYGPLRPRLTMGPVQRNADAARVFDPLTSAQAQAEAIDNVTRGFLRWYIWGGLGLLAFSLAAAAGAGCLRMLVVLRAHNQAGEDAGPQAVAEIWHHLSGAIARMTALAVAVSALAWVAAGGLAYAGTVHGLSQVGSLTDLVGSSRVSPEPAGPTVTGFTGAVIGDSRAVRVGGPPVVGGSPGDAACGRSTDSLAAEVGSLLDTPVLNLACPSATTAAGLLGPQERSGILLPPQVGVLKQVQGLRFVVVAIGPNDVGWSDLVTYCYAVENCADNLSRGEFDYRLAAFDRDYGTLLAELAGLSGQPQVVIVTSYDALPDAPDPACPDLRGPANAAGLTPAEVELLNARNDELNALLVAGAQKYGFGVARPRLSPLCGDKTVPEAVAASGTTSAPAEPTPDPAPGTPATSSLGPDLQGLADAFPFHPTGIGSLRTAAAVARLIAPDTDGH